MKVVIALLALGTNVLAYVAPAPKRVGKLAATKEDMTTLAESNPDYLGQSLGLWDPLGNSVVNLFAKWIAQGV